MTADDIVDLFVRLNEETLQANPNPEDQETYPNPAASLAATDEMAVLEAARRIFRANEAGLLQVAQESGPEILLMSVIGMSFSAGLVMGRQEAAKAMEDFGKELEA